MEDAATAEISRAQVWQWLHFGSHLDDGQTVTPALFARVVEEEMERVRREVGETRYTKGRFDDARALFVKLSTAERFEDFLTVPAYEVLLAAEPVTTG